MPPRYAYWTIIVDDQPTAFRAGALEDIMPTFNRLKDKQPTAKLMWFQSGRLWPSRIDAREAMQMRGERGRERDPRQARGNVARNVASSPQAFKPSSPGRSIKPEWKPKGSSSPQAFKPSSPGRSTKPSSPGRSTKPEGKRKWIPKAEYKKATGTEAKRDDKWRPGGEHKDPRQKYKDAKKAKWGRFKQAIRTRAAKMRSDK